MKLETQTPETPILTYGATQAIEQCRAWLLIKLSGENCMNTAGDVLEEIKDAASDPDTFFQEIHRI